MKYIKTFENMTEYERIKNSNNIISFERTFRVSDKKILNIIETLKQKNIPYELYYVYNDSFKETFIKIYGKSNRTKTLRHLGFNILPNDYTFTWHWKSLETDIHTFINATKYNL